MTHDMMGSALVSFIGMSILITSGLWTVARAVQDVAAAIREQKDKPHD